MYFVHPQIKLKDFGKAVFPLIRKPDLEKLYQNLSFYFPEKQFIFTDMGRSAFKVIVEKLNLANSEILMPAYICDIFAPILKTYNIKPIFLDIDLKTFHIKIDQIQNKISPKTKAILVCHTYGLPFDIETIRTSNNSNIANLLIIEDCAHAFLGEVGKSGDVVFFSLYKQFPTLRGGMLVCPPDWEAELPRTFFNFRDFISFLNCFSVFAFLFKKFGGRVAPKMIRKEKILKPASINRASLRLFSTFLPDFKKSLEKRIKLALIFQEELKKIGFEVQESRNNVFCYLSALVPKEMEQKRDKLVQELRKYRVFCTRIWHTPIILNPEVKKEYQINLAEFPNTVEAAKRIINFPLQNYYTEKDIRKIITFLQKTLSQFIYQSL